MLPAAVGCDKQLIYPLKQTRENKCKALMSPDCSLVYSRTMQGEIGQSTSKERWRGGNIIWQAMGGHSDEPMLYNVAVR